MSDAATLYESTYQWTCNACHTQVLAIRRNEKTRVVSVACPFCNVRLLVSPTIRREQSRKLVTASPKEASCLI